MLAPAQVPLHHFQDPARAVNWSRRSQGLGSTYRYCHGYSFSLVRLSHLTPGTFVQLSQRQTEDSHLKEPKAGNPQENV